MDDKKILYGSVTFGPDDSAKDKKPSVPHGRIEVVPPSEPMRAELLAQNRRMRTALEKIASHYWRLCEHKDTDICRNWLEETARAALAAPEGEAV